MFYCIWPDDTWCEESELEEFLEFKSDDYIKFFYKEEPVGLTYSSVCKSITDFM